jgi:hypothetical protein
MVYKLYNNSDGKLYDKEDLNISGSAEKDL